MIPSPVPWDWQIVGSHHFLPKAEYALLTEVWVDVTKDCEVGVVHTNISIGSLVISGAMRDGYRLRKIEAGKVEAGPQPTDGRSGYAFIVERRTP